MVTISEITAGEAWIWLTNKPLQGALKAILTKSFNTAFIDLDWTPHAIAMFTEVCRQGIGCSTFAERSSPRMRQ
jgi:hypothetical protein